MKNKNVIGIVFSLCSAVFYVLAIIGFSSGSGTEFSAVWLCLGSALLCTSTVLNRRTNEDEKKDDEAVEDAHECADNDAHEDVAEDETVDIENDSDEESTEE